MKRSVHAEYRNGERLEHWIQVARKLQIPEDHEALRAAVKLRGENNREAVFALAELRKLLYKYAPIIVADAVVAATT